MNNKEINGDIKLTSSLKNQIFLTKNLKKYLNLVKIKLKVLLFCKNHDYTLLTENPSPSRYLQELFIKNEVPKYIHNNVSILDVGCGDSKICKLLSDKDIEGEYVGVDLLDYYNKDLGKENLKKNF